jgi:hypothetical protein
MYYQNNLGFDWGSAFNAAGNITSSIIGSRTAGKAIAAEADMMEQQRIIEQQRAESQQKILKIALIGGGVIITGSLLIYALTRD